MLFYDLSMSLYLLNSVIRAEVPSTAARFTDQSASSRGRRSKNVAIEGGIADLRAQWRQARDEYRHIGSDVANLGRCDDERGQPSQDGGRAPAAVPRQQHLSRLGDPHPSGRTYVHPGQEGQGVGVFTAEGLEQGVLGDGYRGLQEGFG
jgi:hypothetical protein